LSEETQDILTAHIVENIASLITEEKENLVNWKSEAKKEVVERFN